MIKSRAEADTRCHTWKSHFQTTCCTSQYADDFDEEVAEQLAKGGYFYIMHRFDEAGAFLYQAHARSRAHCFHFGRCQGLRV